MNNKKMKYKFYKKFQSFFSDTQITTNKLYKNKHN